MTQQGPQDDTRVPVVQYGLGPIGTEIARLVLQRPALRLAGAVDPHPQKMGRDVGTVLGIKRKLGIRVEPSGKSLLRRLGVGAVVIQATGSRLSQVAPQLEEAIGAGASVISTCEELAFPFHSAPELATRFDLLAQRHGVSVLGTGVNPGFVMDVLPATLTSVCAEVRTIRVLRIVDTSTRRRQLQAKTGVGLSVDQFRRKVEEGRIGHVGLSQSARLIAHANGWDFDNIRESVVPVLGPSQEKSSSVQGGRVVQGLRQTVQGFVNGREMVKLELSMTLRASRPRDEIWIDGRPTVHLVMPGGIFGDTASAAMTVNCVDRIQTAPHGLVTMLDLPLVGCAMLRALATPLSENENRLP